MSDHFPDTTSYQHGCPSELTGAEQRRGPSLPMLCLLLLLALAALLFAMSEALAADASLRARTAEGPALGARGARIEPSSLVAPAEQLLLQLGAELGEVRVQVTPPDPRLDLPACTALDAFLPPGARPQGHTTVAVRCTGPTHWTVYLQAQVQVIGNYLAAARPLAAGQVLAANDVVVRSGDLNDLPPGVISDVDSVVGRPLALSLGAGQPLRRDGLKSIPVVLAGQTVRLVAHGQGFSVSGDGVALTAASEGQSVQVRTPRGTQVSGTAHSGAIVEIRL